jgi:acyl-CoA synthetase (AMP-forming)/AMP-acid ligase II
MQNARAKNESLEKGETPGMITNFTHGIFDKIIFSKIRERLGGQVKFMVGGGAATSVEVIRFFDEIGVPIFEGYGLTETGTIRLICDGYSRLSCSRVRLYCSSNNFFINAWMEEQEAGMCGHTDAWPRCSHF